MSATLHVFQCRLHEPCARVWICMHSVMVISIEGLFLNGLRIAQRSAAALKTEKLNSTATAQLNNFCRAALRNSFTLSPLLHATSLTAMRRHGVLGPLGLGSQAPPLPHCILPYWR